MKPHWVIQQVDRAKQEALADALAISPITASVLLARGLVSTEDAQRWLGREQVARHDPFLLPDMERAIDRLHHAVIKKERICFYGDYDVDGMSASSLYLTFFRGLGADATVYIPHRLREGYGLHAAALRQIQSEGIRVVVTSDCGSTSHQEVAEANRVGLDVIITDHHQLDAEVPPACAVLNPYRADARYPFQQLCSAGLAYKVAQAYQYKYGCGDVPLDQTLDLVALATVADVVPLQDENRIFVREGLLKINSEARKGIAALKAVAGIERECTTSTIAFRLAPRLNAAGRLAHALAGVRLLTTDSEEEAAQVAGDLEALNRERQRLEETSRIEAEQMVEGEPPAAIVVSSRAWHLGVVGIVAARLVDRFQQPAIVLAGSEDGICKGSARTVRGFDIHAALAACRDLLIGFGGHPAAAGLTIHEAQLPAFRERLQGLAAEWGRGQPHASELIVDAEVRLTDIDRQLVCELGLLEPYGVGNPEPTLAVRNLRILDSRVVGERHLKLTVRHQSSAPFDTIGFRMGSLSGLGLSSQHPVDLAFVPQMNRWNGLDRVQLRIRDLRQSQDVYY